MTTLANIIARDEAWRSGRMGKCAGIDSEDLPCRSRAANDRHLLLKAIAAVPGLLEQLSGKAHIGEPHGHRAGWTDDPP